MHSCTLFCEHFFFFGRTFSLGPAIGPEGMAWSCDESIRLGVREKFCAERWSVDGFRKPHDRNSVHG